MLFFLLMLTTAAGAQAPRVRCTERQVKSNDPEIKDPVLRTTCYLGSYRFIETAFPDYAGRYVEREHSVFVRVQGRWQRTTNSRVFNGRQGELLARINRGIREEWEGFRADSNTRDCMEGVAAPPRYGMNDLAISFHDGAIWFSVEWDVPMACRAVGGAIITFPLKDVAQYLR
ncbi:hypothetical protein [Flaviaesturariibacter amylovorans]